MPNQPNTDTLSEGARWRHALQAEFGDQFSSGLVSLAVGLLLLVWLWTSSLVAMYARLGWLLVPMVVVAGVLVVAVASLAMALQQVGPRLKQPRSAAGATPTPVNSTSH